jgi:SAM-dependent methyltransferase
MSTWPRNEFGPNLDFGDEDAVARALGIGPKDRVLEVGGASNAFRRADVVCDLTFGESCQRNGAPAVFAAGRRYVEAPAERLPFADGEFDFVICRQVLEHVADPPAAAGELARVARRGLVEVPSRAGEMLNGNPSHRWIVDLDGEILVFHRRCFVEHPFDNLMYGRLFADRSLRERAEGRYRNLLNHQVAFRGRLLVQVVEPDGPAFDYDDPAQAARSHHAFARNCLRLGADPTYAFSDARLAARLLPGDPRATLLLATYQLRLLQIDDALRTLEGLEDNASASLRRLAARVRDGEAVDLRWLPVPDPLGPKIAAAPHTDRPRVAIVVPAASTSGLRAAVESVVAQDYPDVEAVVATGLGTAETTAELGHLSGIARVRLVQVPGRPALPALLNEGLRACRSNLVGFAVPPDRLEGQHLDRLVAGLLASGADGAHGDRVLLDGSGVLAPDLAAGDPSTSTFSPSTLILRIEAAHDAGAFDVQAAPGLAVARWLGELAARFHVVHVPVATVETGARPVPRPAVVDEALAQLRLRPLDLYRELVALHAQREALTARLRELEADPGAAREP